MTGEPAPATARLCWTTLQPPQSRRIKRIKSFWTSPNWCGIGTTPGSTTGYCFAQTMKTGWLSPASSPQTIPSTPPVMRRFQIRRRSIPPESSTTKTQPGWRTIGAITNSLSDAPGQGIPTTSPGILSSPTMMRRLPGRGCRCRSNTSTTCPNQTTTMADAAMAGSSTCASHSNQRGSPNFPMCTPTEMGPSTTFTQTTRMRMAWEWSTQPSQRGTSSQKSQGRTKQSSNLTAAEICVKPLTPTATRSATTTPMG